MGGGGDSVYKQCMRRARVSMSNELRPLLSEGQQDAFGLETNRIYNPGYSEVREPGYGLRHRISGWSQRAQSLRLNPINREGYTPLSGLTNVEESVSIPIEEETSFSVDIPEETVSETTGLLSGTSSAAVGGTATGVLGTGLTGAQAGLVGTIGVGAVGAGIIASAVKKNGAVLPGHHYIGPGNPLNGQEPVDKDDEIAKEHDEAYVTAKTSQDVINADRTAIEKFGADYDTHGNWHSLLGKTGLQIKTAVEQKFGVIYPSVLRT